MLYTEILSWLAIVWNRTSTEGLAEVLSFNVIYADRIEINLKTNSVRLIYGVQKKATGEFIMNVTLKEWSSKGKSDVRQYGNFLALQILEKSSTATIQ